MNDCSVPNPNLPWYSDETPWRAEETIGVGFLSGFGGAAAGLALAGLLDGLFVNGFGFKDELGGGDPFYAFFVFGGIVAAWFALAMYAHIGPRVLFKPMTFPNRDIRDTHVEYHTFSFEKQEVMREIYMSIMSNPDDDVRYELCNIFRLASYSYDQREKLSMMKYSSPILESARETLVQLQTEVNKLKTE